MTSEASFLETVYSELLDIALSLPDYDEPSAEELRLHKRLNALLKKIKGELK